MHTHKHKDTSFVYNSDLSGNVRIVHDGKELDVPGEALIAFVAEHARRQRISQIENASDFEILTQIAFR